MSKREQRCLIIKTSSYGDILHTIDVLQYLRKRQNYKIDWVVEKRCLNLLEEIRGIDRIIVCDFRNFWKKCWKKNFWIELLKDLRWNKYDVVFDLQGNCKSGLVTLLSRAYCKVGFGKKAVREWPNLLVTSQHINVDRGENLRKQYLDVVKTYFNDFSLFTPQIEFLGKNVEKKREKISGKLKVMLCPFSKWPQKMMDPQFLLKFMQKIKDKYGPDVFCIFGNEKEEKYLKNLFSSKEWEKIVFWSSPSFAEWQRKMQDMDIVITVDSCSLALCGISGVRSFSIFGPTKKEVIMPFCGDHFAVQLPCCYGLKFVQICSKWRNCSSSCMMNGEVEQAFSYFADVING